MTKSQALFVLYLRNESMMGCSWRALAAHYQNRYDRWSEKLIPFEDREDFSFGTFGGNQIDGMELESSAYEILFDEQLLSFDGDLFECDLTQIRKEFNLKNHYE